MSGGSASASASASSPDAIIIRGGAAGFSGVLAAGAVLALSPPP